MKILKLMLRILPVTVFLNASYTQEYSYVRQYLDQVTQSFEAASTPTQKADIALQPVDCYKLISSGGGNLAQNFK